MKTYQFFLLPVGNEKIPEKIEFHSIALVLKYYQESSNGCFLISIES